MTDADDPPEVRGATRRRLLGGAAILLAGGAGVGAGALHAARPTPLPPRPADLQLALDRETALIAAVDAARAVLGENVRERLAVVRQDHVAHAQALSALLTPYAVPSPSPSLSAPSAPSGSRSLADLARSETAAATAGAGASSATVGQLAVLLAVIAACEASHAELLR